MKRKSRQTSNIPLSCSTGVIVSHGTLSAQATSSQAHCTPTHPLEPFSQSRTPSKRHPQKSAEFWLLDGSVVIQIDDTVFRLYRSHLARRSPFFAALFAQGEPPAHYDSHPLYTVTSVSVNDFTELLRAEDIGIDMMQRMPPFPALAALLRAAHTLDFRSWRSFAIRHLQASAPPSLSIRLPHAAQTLALARACGLRSVAKRALYELMRTPAFGQRPSEDSDDEDMYADEFAEAADRLSSADIFMLFRALRKAQRVWMRVVRTPPLPSIVPCPLDLLGDALALSQGPMREACQVARAQADMLWMEHVIRGPLHEEGLTDPLYTLDRMCDLDWREWGFCVGCVAGRRELWEEEKERLWKKMDQWFGLESMEEDQGDFAEAIGPW